MNETFWYYDHNKLQFIDENKSIDAMNINAFFKLYKKSTNRPNIGMHVNLQKIYKLSIKEQKKSTKLPQLSR